MNNNIIKKLKKFFSFSTFYECDYNWVCLNCGKLFDGNATDLLITHQTDNNHYNAEKRNKL